MVRKFHPPVHKSLVLKALDTAFPEDIKRKLMPHIFPAIKVDEDYLEIRLKRCAPKQMSWTSNTIKICLWNLIGFLLDEKATSLRFDDLMNAERRYLHEWCECLALRHESLDSDVPRSVLWPDDEPPDRVLVISKPPLWSIQDILPPRQKTPEERGYYVNRKGNRVLNRDFCVSGK